MNKRLILGVFLTSFFTSVFCLCKAVFATATPTQCNLVSNGMAAVEIEKSLGTVQINTDQPIEILNLFQGKNEEWEIKEIGKDIFEVSINNKETTLTSVISKWQLSEDNFELNFQIEIKNLQTSNKNLEPIGLQLIGKKLNGSIVTDKDLNLYLAIESPDKYFPPIQRSLKLAAHGTATAYMQDGERVCICCNNGGTGCTTRQCNSGSACGIDQAMGAFCKWISRSAAGKVNDLIFGISFFIAFLSGYRLTIWR